MKIKSMKIKLPLFAILFSTISSFAQVNAPKTGPSAPPPELEGTYSLKQHGIGLASARHELLVFMLNQDAQKYVASLRAQQYACQNFDARHVKCSRFIKDLQSIGSSFENVYDLYKNEKLEIQESRFPAELINDAEYLAEWKKLQNAKWMGQEFTDLYYAIIKDPTQPEDLIKLTYTNDADQKAYFYMAPHVGGVDIAFQHMEVLKLEPTNKFVISENLNCLLEVHLAK